MNRHIEFGHGKTRQPFFCHRCRLSSWDSHYYRARGTDNWHTKAYPIITDFAPVPLRYAIILAQLALYAAVFIPFFSDKAEGSAKFVVAGLVGCLDMPDADSEGIRDVITSLYVGMLGIRKYLQIIPHVHAYPHQQFSSCDIDCHL